MTELLREGIQPLTTVITVSELFFGAFRRGWISERLAILQRAVAAIEILPLSAENAPKVALVRAQLTHRGEDIGYADSAIAGIALAAGIPILTRNIKHFSRVKILSENSDVVEQLQVNTW